MSSFFRRLLVFIAALAAFFMLAGCHGDGSHARFAPYADGLDYSNPQNWYLVKSHQPNAVDVFVIYPTVVFDENEPEFVNVNSEALQQGIEEFDQIAVTPVLGDLGVNIYMPKYRQLNGWYITQLPADQAQAAIADIPKKDVFNAFAYYMKHWNAGHRFDLYSHSQGSILNNLLMSQFMPKYLSFRQQDRMVASYMIGIGITPQMAAKTPYKISTSPLDTRSIVSWNTATPNEISDSSIWRATWSDGMKAVNPITFTNSTVASDASKNPESIISYFNAAPVSKSHLTGAKLVNLEKDGKTGQAIQIDLNEKDFLTDEQIAGQNQYNLGYTHHWDISLFVDTVKENFKKRNGI